MMLGPIVTLASLLTACTTREPPAPLFDEPSKERQPEMGASFDFRPLEGFPAIRHHADHSTEKLMPEIMGAGVALLDLDRDGALDLVVPDGGKLIDGPEGRPVVLRGDGKGGFTDVTASWGLTAKGFGMGVSAGDIDNDGWTDLYLTTYGGNDRLLRNTGTRFEDVTEAWGIAPEGWSTSSAFFDADEDGDLDLYVVRYIDYTPENSLKCWFKTIHIYCTPTLYDALPDRLYRNDGGKFVDISDESGITAQRVKGLAVSTGDLDLDGHTDVYVGNDTSQNLLFMGAGDATFSEKGILAGVAYSEVGKEEASMGVSITDANRDGRWDLAVTNFQGEPTSIYFGREIGYRERSDAVGVGAASRARLAFGLEWLDADNDGDDDLIQANGHINLLVNEFRQSVTAEQKNTIFENRDGKFEDVTERAGQAFQQAALSRGLAVGDIDADGGVDFVVANNNGDVQVAMNRTEQRGNWLTLWLEGEQANRSAIGAVVTARWGDELTRREIRGASSYLSVSSRFVHFGLADHEAVDELEIRWPGGQTQKLGTVKGNRHLHIVQGADPVEFTPGEKVLEP